jgi:glycosyltransferase involved in cell wall biosynthesis
VLYVWRPSFVDALDSRHRFDAAIYHIDDEYSFSETHSPMTADELRLIREANSVIVHSPGLMALKGGINRKTFMVPNGVDYELYAQPAPPPPDLLAIPAPRIGYVGVIKRQLDFALLRSLAQRRRDWSFVLIGPLRHFPGDEAEIEELTAKPNIHLLGYRDVAALPAYQGLLDVCIMPYRVNAYTDCIYPLKLHEYLASGKPIVATPIRTLKDFSTLVSLASGVDAWVASLESCLTPEAHTREQVSARQAIAKQHDWWILAERIAAIIAEDLGRDVRERVLNSNS